MARHFSWKEFDLHICAAKWPTPYPWKPQNSCKCHLVLKVERKVEHLRLCILIFLLCNIASQMRLTVGGANCIRNFYLDSLTIIVIHVLNACVWSRLVLLCVALMRLGLRYTPGHGWEQLCTHAPRPGGVTKTKPIGKK
ncbi:hypothetical protein K449DRAFT_431273 [Hypoxylon sp. EC38]|nr:hypothetical protein K449DRAFT_431273 [Hypoxylon sp. EC38]